MALAAAGIVLTLFFGIWSMVTGKLKVGSRFIKIFLVFLVLYSGQVLGAKWLRQPPLSPSAFSTAVFMMTVWLMAAAFREND